ncbi:unnamed protein product [Danaus chrysippus]|uniref:(African queen) hypothetical protein n=1 Tax=Danaus chrysippus TaxID=151541 RepID=A0A8J2VTV2_9NEOP|nr:unnamed protein product [Danaus chrysippus]
METAVPEFRILAPQIICPNHDNISSVKRDFSVITIQPNTVTDFQLSWIVRWVSLPSLSQRMTLNLWKLVRALEKKLNEQSANDFDYIIENNEFSWSVSSKPEHVINVSHIIGSKLEIPANTLQPELTYEVICEIKTYSSDDFITEVALTVSVLRRKLQVYLNIDELVVPLNEAFAIEAFIIYDDLKDTTIEFEWVCTSNEKSCDFFENRNERIYNVSQGISEEGIYDIHLNVIVLQEVAKTNATIRAIKGILPVLQIQSINRVMNENQEVHLVGKASNLAPSCHLTWYFATAEYLASESTYSVNDSWNGFTHGYAISESLTLNSIEENFLYEYIDFTNETYTRQIEAKMKANNGTARLVAECNCSFSFDCETHGLVYGNLHLELNESPYIYNFTVYPESGLALESLFRLSASASDPDGPLRFTFYYVIDNRTIPLASYLGHSAIETHLPYIVGGTDVLVEVCDSLNACSRSKFINVKVYPSDADIDKLADKARAHIRRREITDLTLICISTVISLSDPSSCEIKPKKRGRPTGKNRTPLSLEEKRARNAQYERERRHAASEAMSILAEASGCDPSVETAKTIEMVAISERIAYALHYMQFRNTYSDVSASTQILYERLEYVIAFILHQETFIPLSNADILATALAQIQRASEREPEDDIAHIRRCNEKLLLQVEILEERLSNWEEPENNSDTQENEETAVNERKRKADFDENNICKIKKCKSEENLLNTSFNSDIIDSDTLEMFCTPSDLNIIESVCSEWVNEEPVFENKDNLLTLDSFVN